MLFAKLYNIDISPLTPLNYSYDGIIIFGGDAEGVAVVVRAVVGEVSVVVTSTDGCVDLVHGDVLLSELYEEGDDVECHLAVYAPAVAVGFYHFEAGEEGVVAADGLETLR